MRTTLALDDDLVAKAQSLTGLMEKSGLVREALKALIEREAARRLAVLETLLAPMAVVATDAEGRRMIDRFVRPGHWLCTHLLASGGGPC
jgi:predicted transcriptional regulator